MCKTSTISRSSRMAPASSTAWLTTIYGFAPQTTAFSHPSCRVPQPSAPQRHATMPCHHRRTTAAAASVAPSGRPDVRSIFDDIKIDLRNMLSLAIYDFKDKIIARCDTSINWNWQKRLYNHQNCLERRGIFCLFKMNWTVMTFLKEQKVKDGFYLSFGTS